ncbi:MAG TPA: GGDEF domain-containing protein [Polyangiaceae bacterium]|nr:GGDEF domain-containing protein [Polyangiaceae bacterium]
MPEDFEFDDEATAVVNLTELRAARSAQKKHHLLVHVQGSELGRVRVLEATEILLGRAADADVWLADDGVSRRHARLVRHSGRYAVEDLNSANGTFVQGERILRHVLEDGDQIQLGPHAVFRYSMTDEDQKNLLEQLYATSVTDALTGARNREYLDGLLVSEISFAKRHDTALSFLLFDLDHFKRVNDTYGHPAGDAVLTEVVRAVRAEMRAEDCLCRYGGEEFALVLRAIDTAGARILAERIRQTVSELVVRHESHEIRLTVSIGCGTLWELEDATPTALIELADRRLYSAKRAGRNRVVAEDLTAQPTITSLDPV